MAVYTILSNDEISAFLTQYKVGKLISAKGIAEGISNTNYKLELAYGEETVRYILTVFEKNFDAKDLPFFVELTAWLSSRGVPCPHPIKMTNGNAISQIAGKPAMLVPFIEGENNPEIKMAHLDQVGSWMAKMHTTAERFPFYRHNSLALDGLQKIFASIRGQVNTIAPNLEKDIDEEITFLRRSWPYGLPSGIIHGDVFPDNVFFTGNDTVKPKLSGVIDFYFSCSDFWIYDVLICMNAWCFDPGNRRFLPTRAKILFEGYGKVRTVTMPEKQAMPTLARAAALRFLLTRCRDWIYRVDGAVVTAKDPMEYFEKLRFHREVRGYWNYGL